MKTEILWGKAKRFFGDNNTELARTRGPQSLDTQHFAPYSL